MFNRNNVMFFDHPDFCNVFLQHQDYACVMRYNVNISGELVKDTSSLPPKPVKPKNTKNTESQVYLDYVKALEKYKELASNLKGGVLSEQDKMSNQRAIVNNFLWSVDSIGEDGKPINPQFFRVKQVLIMEDYYERKERYHEHPEPSKTNNDFITARLNHLAALIKKFDLADEIYFVSYKKSAFKHIDFSKLENVQCVYLPITGEPELVTERPKDKTRKSKPKTE